METEKQIISNPVRNPQNQNFCNNLNLSKKQSKISNGANVVKKTFAVLFLVSFLIGLIAPSITFAATSTEPLSTGPLSSCKLKYDFSSACDDCSQCTEGKEVSESVTNAWGLCCILNVIYRVTDIVFWLLIAGAVLLILMGAYYFLTSGGNPENVRKGQGYILYAMVGLVVAFLAKAIASLIKMLF